MLNKQQGKHIQTKRKETSLTIDTLVSGRWDETIQWNKLFWVLSYTHLHKKQNKKKPELYHLVLGIFWFIRATICWCCMTTPSHYMDKCWPTPLNSPDIDPYVVFQIYTFEITTTFPKEHSVKCNDFFNKTPTIFGTTYNPILMLTYMSTGINGYRNWYQYWGINFYSIMMKPN